MAQPRVLSLVWNLIRGGTEGQCARVAMELAGRGQVHRVAVFRREGFFLEAVEQACGPLYHLPIERLASPGTWWQVYWLSRFLSSNRIDLLHAWDADAAVFGRWAAAWAGCGLVTSRRDLGEIYAPWKRRLMHWADLRAQCVVVNADAIRRKRVAEGLPEERIRLVPNLLNLEEFDRLAGDASREGPPLPSAPRVGLVARLDPEKDVATFIRAASRVAQKQPGVSFIVAGDGVERQSLERLVAERGMASRVVFLGEVTDVPSLLARFDIGVLVPSANEGLSNTVLEYMAAGLPSVVTRCGGNPELVRDDETGYVVEIGDDRALADRILALLAAPERARGMGLKARSRVEMHHAPRVVADAFEALYREAAGLG